MKSTLRPIAPHEVSTFFENDPKSIGMKLTEIPVQLGITPDELLTELRAGRLQAHGVKINGGYNDLFVSMPNLAKWIARDDLPYGMRDRILSMLKARAKH
jgi:hypothetical protein